MGNCFSSQGEAVRPVHSNIVSCNIASTSFATSNGNSETTSAPNTTGSSNSNVTSSFGSFAYSFTQGSELPRFNSNSQGSAHKFTYSELKQATKNFKKDWRLGEGGFGTVFRGYIDELTMAPCKPGQGMTVAVKRLNLDGFQGHREWLTEVYFLGGLSHPNLVKLIGYCAEEDNNRLLVYEFMTRGSLENHLFRKRNNSCLSWELRIKVAVGAARGLAFLHDSQTRVIYRDFKAANILLDDYYNAKLSDFGLAKDGPQGDATHVSTRVMGTYGYAAPEYLATGHLSARSDVYSFGVVLLELLTGRRALDTSLVPGEQKLVEWARPFLAEKRRLLRIIDQRLDGQYSQRGAMRLAELASECVNEDSKARPTMKDVLQVLEKIERPRIRSSNLSENSSGHHTTKAV